MSQSGTVVGILAVSPQIMERIRLVVGSLAMVLCLAGFDFSRHSIPLDRILSGGPPKDGIPAILDPKFVSAKQADFLQDDDRLIGIVENGTAKAYPLRILDYHEVVNDQIGGKAVAVTY